jgi:hypothetical protein
MNRGVPFIVNHCLKKRSYPSWEEAESEALRTMEEAPDGQVLMAYKCQLAEHWHVGHDSPGKRQRALNRSGGGGRQ